MLAGELGTNAADQYHAVAVGTTGMLEYTQDRIMVPLM
jgi:hypothetical protein